jgi:hypothetical protein
MNKISNAKYSTKFQEDHDLAKRSQICHSIISKYPERIPVIVETTTDSYRKGVNRVIQLNKTKYLCPNELSYAGFVFELRKHIKNLNSTEAIFLFIVTPNRLYLPNASQPMSEIWNLYRQEDMFLYFYVCLENCYGMIL